MVDQDPDTLRPGLTSAILRTALAIVAMAILSIMPENIRTWSDPNATVITTQRTMPLWGNYAVGIAMAATAIALVWGWFARRAHKYPVRWTVVVVTSVVLQFAWAAALLLSQSLALGEDGAADGQPVGIYQDALFAAIAIVTVLVLKRDILAARAASMKPTHTTVV